MEAIAFILIGIIITLFIMLTLLYYFCPISLLIIAAREGLKLSPTQLISMRIRKINPYPIVQAAINLHKEGINIDVSQLESHALAGGHINKVANVLIAAKKENREISFMDVCALDLMGKL